MGKFNLRKGAGNKCPYSPLKNKGLISPLNHDDLENPNHEHKELPSEPKTQLVKEFEDKSQIKEDKLIETERIITKQSQLCLKKNLEEFSSSRKYQ